MRKSLGAAARGSYTWPWISTRSGTSSWTSGNTRAPPPHVVPSTVTGKTSMPLSTAVHSSSMHQSLSKILGDMKKTSFPDARTLALSLGSSSSSSRSMNAR